MMSRGGRWRQWLVGALVLAAVSAADRAGWLLVPVHDDQGAYRDTTTNIKRVVTADLIEVAIPDRLRDTPTTRVQLWGVNVPKSDAADPSHRAVAREARLFVEAIAADETITIRIEPHAVRSPFGPVLAHVDLATGETLNALMLERGWGVVDDRLPHSMLREYARREMMARRNKVGVWAPDETD